MNKVARCWSALAAVVLSLSSAGTSYASPLREAAADGGAADQAAGWLAGQLVDGAMPGFVGPEWGLTIDAQFGLIAANADPAVIASVVDAVQTHVPDFAGPGWYPDPEARIAGATAKVLVAAVTANKDVHDFGGRDLRQETLDLVAGADAGVEQGRLRDKATGADDTNTFSQALGIIGLARSGGVPETLVSFLARQQCAAGYFRMFYNDKQTCDEAKGEPDNDGTALAVQAMITARNYGLGGYDERIAEALDWLESAQKPDGSYGGGVGTEGANANSTGLVAQALTAGGRTAAADKAAAWVESMQLTTATAGAAAAHAGAIAYNADVLADARTNGIDLGIDQWRRSTTQAVFGLAPVGFAELSWTDPNPQGPRPTATVTATATATTTTTATATRTATATVTRQPVAGSTVTRTDPGPTRTATTTATAPPLPRATSTRTVVVVPSSPALPRAQQRASVSTPVSSRPVRGPIAPANTTGMDADDTASYLQRQLTGGNRVEVVRAGRRYVDYDTTFDLALALRQGDKLPGTVAAIGALVSQPQVVDAYAHGAPYEKQARYAGPLAKLTLLAALTKTGAGLADELVARIQPDGRITDDSRSGDQSDVTSQAYGVLALTAAGRTEDAAKAAEALLREQCGDGSFPAGFEPAERRCQTGDVAATALAVQALNAKSANDEDRGVAAGGALARAVGALGDAQDVDGAWSSGWQQSGRPNVPATAKAVVAFQSAGLDVTAAKQRLTSAIRPDGGLPIWPGEGTNVAASIAGLPALAGGSLLSADKTVLDRAGSAPFDDGAGSTTTAMSTDSRIGTWPAVTGFALLLVVAGAVAGWLVSRRRGATR